MAKKKILLIAGHGEGDPGACSVWGQEADYTRELATLVQKSLGSKADVTMYPQEKNCYAQSKKGNVPNYAAYDMTLEIHFNAKAKKDPYGDGSFTGVGGYKHPDNGAASIARLIVDKVVALGFKEWLIDNSTGLLNLNRAQGQGARYFLLETAFIDDGDDMNFYSANKGRVAKAIAQGLLEGLGSKATAEDPEEQEYYRVRKSWEDEKSQKFAGTKKNALALCKTLPGYSVYDPKGKCIYTNESTGTLASSFKGVSEAEYIQRVAALYTEEEKKTGILACVSLAQSILESGYGQTDLAQKANNLHGMKCSLSGNTWAGTTWNGDKYTKMSPEQDPAGNETMKESDFRCYPCIEDSIADHSAYLLNAAKGKEQRYEGLAGEKDYKKAVKIIKDGGYATDVKYDKKLEGIIEKWELTKYNADGAGEQPDGKPGEPDKPAKPEEPGQEGYLVNTTCDVLNIRSGPGTVYPVVGTISEPSGRKKDYTIVEEKGGWGRLKSGAGWISLSYTRRVDGEGDVPYLVNTTCDVLNIRSGPSTGYSVVGTISEPSSRKKDYTIVEERGGWGRLKSGAGWISLRYTKRA